MTPGSPPESWSAHHTSGDLKLALPPEVVEQIAWRAAEILAERGQPQVAAEAWITLAEAAEYLACKPRRLYALKAAGRIPHRKDGERVLFRRSELDRWLVEGGGRVP